MEKNKQSRRAFFSSLNRANNKEEQCEKIKMLTADGQLVEVSKSVIQHKSPSIKTSNQEILKWVKK